MISRHHLHRPEVLDRPQDFRRLDITASPLPREDALREIPRPGTFEWWYCDMDLDDGTRVVIAFETKGLPASAGPLSPRLSLTVALPDGTIRRVRTEFSPHEFFASDEHCEVGLGSNSFVGDRDRYEISLNTPEISGRLTLSPTTPAMRVGTGIVDFGRSAQRYFGWFVAVPRGVVHGTLVVDGRKRTVDGIGYHDKNWGVLDFTETLEDWHWFRAFTGKSVTACLILNTSRTVEKARIPLLVSDHTGRILAHEATDSTYIAHASDITRPDTNRRRVYTARFTWRNEIDLKLCALTPLSHSAGNSVRYRRASGIATRINGPRDDNTAVGTAMSEHARFGPRTDAPHG